VLARRGEGGFGVALGFGEETLGVERRRAAGAGRGDRLPVDVILDVAGGEDSRNVRLGRLALRDEVAVLVVVERLDEELRRRVVADRDEQAVCGVVARFLRLELTQAHAG